MSRFERRFWDAVSAWVAIGKLCPVLSADSGMNFPPTTHPESDPILSVDSGTQFPLEASFGNYVPV